MGRVSNWSSKNARIRAKIGLLSSPSKYSKIAGSTFEHACVDLKTEPPSGIEFDDTTDFQNTLSSSLYKCYENHLVLVGKILDGKYKNVFFTALEETIINDIKHLIRRIALGHNDQTREKARYIALNNSKLLKNFSNISDMTDLDEALKGTPFHKPFKLARSTFMQGGNILGFEIALDRDFHSRLHKTLKTLPEPDKTISGRLFRKLCDIKNLLWILRYKFNYQLTEVEIFNYAIDEGFELNDGIIKKLAKASTTGEFISILSFLNCGKFIIKSLKGNTTSPSVISIEDSLAKYREKLLHGSLTTSPFGLAPFLAYLWLKMLEKDRYERIITGLDLQFPVEDILESLNLHKEVSIV